MSKSVSLTFTFYYIYNMHPTGWQSVLHRTYIRKSLCILTYFYSGFTFVYALLYWFLLCELGRKGGAKSSAALNPTPVCSVVTVFLPIPAGSVWRECGPPQAYISSQSPCHREFHSVPARIGLFETHACRGTEQSCEWMPSLDPYRL